MLFSRIYNYTFRPLLILAAAMIGAILYDYYLNTKPITVISPSVIVYQENDQRVLRVEGPFSRQTVASLENAIEGETHIDTIEFHSPGGSSVVGVEIGNIIKDLHGVDVRVNSGDMCLSACAIAFIGARNHIVTVDGLLAFHAAYLNFMPIDFSPAKLVNTTNEMLVDTVRYMTEMGYYDLAYIDMLEYTNRTTYFAIRNTEEFHQSKSGFDKDNTITSMEIHAYSIVNMFQKREFDVISTY